MFEIGSGSGQHALHFVDQLPGLRWQPSDTDPYFDGLCQNLGNVSPNILAPQKRDLAQDDWPDTQYDAMYAANVAHIVAQDLVAALIQRAGEMVRAGGFLMLYGPYRYEGNFTTQSNADFDVWLKQRNPQSGIRDFEWICHQAEMAGLVLLEDHVMPANNQLLVFRK